MWFTIIKAAALSALDIITDLYCTLQHGSCRAAQSHKTTGEENMTEVVLFRTCCVCERPAEKAQQLNKTSYKKALYLITTGVFYVRVVQ